MPTTSSKPMATISTSSWKPQRGFEKTGRRGTVTTTLHSLSCYLRLGKLNAVLVDAPVDSRPLGLEPAGPG